MRRALAVFLLAVGLAGLGAGAGTAARVKNQTKSMVITVRLIQEATYQHPHPPPIGLVLSTTLRLYAVGSVLGLPNNAFLGTMSFTYQLHGACSAGYAGCSGTTNLQTLTTFPGGTITANGTNIHLSAGLVVPIQQGTGAFKGVTGTVDIAPGGQANSIYHLTLPANN